ncbi:ATP-grasp domain-containing protein [Cellulomonas telluris]|uniref:ATP-grasp domain-containing protein n=1 Tax=Cellulomonas telluris TaxID=2306636 RepID=UPI0010A935D1|nr:ATP-grasp domain-containing protein [Cellulomonas telluris]
MRASTPSVPARTRPGRRPAVVLFGGVPVVVRHAALVEEARRRGLEVLVVTPPGPAVARVRAAVEDDPSHPLAGVARWLPAAPVVDDVVASVLAVLDEVDVRAVLSCGELFVEACGQVADLLGLPGPGLRASRVCRDKLLQRSYLADLGPRSTFVPPGAQVPAATYPCVVKPTGRMSSSGVRRVDDARALRDVLAAAGEGMLVEELVEGPEVSVEALVQHGEVRWANVTAKTTTEGEGPYFAETAHVLPAALPAPAHASLLRANGDVLAALDLRDGISHAEFRLTPSGPVLMEVAARVPGDGITLMLHLATGAPLEPTLLDLALGEPVDHPAPRRRVGQRFLGTAHGVLRGVAAADGVPVAVLADDGAWPAPAPARADDPSRTVAVLRWKALGSTVGPVRESSDRAVSVLVDAPLDVPLEPVLDAAERTVEVEVEAVDA